MQGAKEHHTDHSEPRHKRRLGQKPRALVPCDLPINGKQQEQGERHKGERKHKITGTAITFEQVLQSLGFDHWRVFQKMADAQGTGHFINYIWKRSLKHAVGNTHHSLVAFDPGNCIRWPFPIDRGTGIRRQL